MCAMGYLPLCIDSNGKKELSVIDYIFVSPDLKQFCKSMTIDEQRLFTPWRKLKAHKRYSDHNAIKFQLDLGVKKPNKSSKRRKVWNFDNPQDWNKFKTLTSNDSTLQEIWHDSTSVERRYEHWSSRLNSILHKCFPKKRLISNKQIYTKEIRRYISERKEVKKKFSRTSGISETGQ